MSDSTQVQIARRIAEDINVLGDAIYTANKVKGFWPASHKQGDTHCLFPMTVYKPDTNEEFNAVVELPARNIGEALMLMVTELAEGCEAHRKVGLDGPGNYGLEASHFTEEMADVVIRLFDLARGFNLPIGEAIAEKLAYNDSRPPKHGKAY